jgi:hypothetical protein
VSSSVFVKFSRNTFKKGDGEGQSHGEITPEAGHASHPKSNSYAHIIGIDPSEEGINWARTHYRSRFGTFPVVI